MKTPRPTRPARLLGKESENLLTRKLLSERDAAVGAGTVRLKQPLCKVETDDANLSMEALSVRGLRKHRHLGASRCRQEGTSTPSTTPATALMKQILLPAIRPVREDAPSGFALLHALSKDILGIWPRAAYVEPHIILNLFGRKIFLFNDPEAVRHVLVDNTVAYCRSPIRNRLIGPVVGHGLVTAEGDEWRTQRRMLAPVFIPKAVDLLTPGVASSAAERVAMLPRESIEIDLAETVSCWTIEIVVKAMLALDVSHELRRLRAMSNFYVRHLASPRTLDVLCPAGIMTPHDIIRKIYGRRWMAFIQGIVDQRLAEETPARVPDLFDFMRAVLDNGSDPVTLRLLLRDQVATMVAGANETTSLAIFWTLYLLAQCPKLQDDVRAEVSNREANAEIFPMGPLLRAALSESLRLYPPNFIIMRMACVPNVVNDVEVPAGSTVMIAPWIIHRHTAFWKNRNQFDIERFLPESPPPERFCYIPYSVGPRVCIGAYFANVVAMQVIGALLSRFRIDLAGPAEVLPSCVVLARPDRKLLARLRAV